MSWSCKTIIFIVSAYSFGALSSIIYPPSPILFSGLVLAIINFLTYSTNSSSVWIVFAPSSATLFAAPGDSISRSISSPFSSSSLFFRFVIPSSLTSAAWVSLPYFSFSIFASYFKSYSLWTFYFEMGFFSFKSFFSIFFFGAGFNSFLAFSFSTVIEFFGTLF